MDGFADAINKLASSEDLRESMRKDCLKAVEPFDIQNALDRMRDISKEILV